MSVAGIASAGLSQLSSLQRNYAQVRSEFKQLGQNLQAGSLSQAQTDFVTLSQSAAASQFSGNGAVAKTLNSLGQALQSGNLSAAQQAFASLPSHIVGPSAISHSAHAESASAPQGSFSQALSQMGQALQTGNLTMAQRAFSAMQQSWQQMGSTGSTAGTNALMAPSVSSGVNLMV
jgi:hypothetical protein